MELWERFRRGMGVPVTGIPASIEEVVNAIANLPTLPPAGPEELANLKKNTIIVTPVDALGILLVQSAFDEVATDFAVTEALRSFLFRVIDRAIEEDGGLGGLVVVVPSEDGERSFVEFGFPDDMEPPAEVR